jgi:zinc-ribbon domain
MTEPAPAAFCTHCGTRLEPGVSFCTACGTAAGPAEPATTTTPAGVAAHQPTAAQPVEHPATGEPMAGSPDAAPAAPGGWTGGPTDGWGEPAYADAVPGGPGSRSRLATGGVVLLVLAVVLAGVGLLAIRRTSAGSPHAAPTPSAVQSRTTANPVPTYAPGPTYAPVPPSDLPTQASAVDALLSMSVASRAAVVQAAAQIGACTSLAGAQATMTAAAATRETAANNAASLPVSALPNGSGLISLLTSMMQASATADRGYAAWAGDVAAGSCNGESAVHTANFTAAEAASAQATALKLQFVAAWSPIATQAGLPTRAADQL